MRALIAGFLFIGYALAEAPPPDDLTVVYTGRTLGYARACREELFRPLQRSQYKSRMGKNIDVDLYERKCEPWPVDQPSYSALLKQQIVKAREKAEKSLTLGAGDHFSLDYRARTALLQKAAGERIAVPMDELYYLEKQGWIWLQDFENRRQQFQEVIDDQAKGNSHLDSDSVAEFLIDAGYNALVPGKHDFYFGPEHVRQVAQLLENKGVRMLGANLVIRGQPLDPKPAREDQFRKSDYARTHQTIKIQLPKVVSPWWRRVKVTVPEGSRFGALELCKASSDLDTACQQGKGIPLTTLNTPGVYELNQKKVEPLDPGATYHLCVTDPYPKIVPGKDGKAKTRYCEVVRVEKPFFYTETNTLPYQVFPKEDAVVFGVVSAGMERQVGKLNAIWRHVAGKGQPEYEVRLEALDPLAAVAQALDYCTAHGDCPPERTRILLAQLPAEAAHGLQQALGKADQFQLVITEASAAQFTPFSRVYFPPDYPPLVVSPAAPYVSGKPGELRLHAQRIELLRKHAGGAVSDGLNPNEGKGLPLPGTDTDIVGLALVKAVERLGVAADLTKLDVSFRDLLLESMRRATKASIAIVQKRDLFEIKSLLKRSPEGVTNDDDRIRAAVESIVWKGDFLLTRLVKGSALKQAMARSKEQDRLDADIYQDRGESRLGLHVLGVFEDPDSKKWVVDGAPLEDDKPYKVALTDYLAFGDTGYPELSQPLSGREQRPAELEVNERISEIVYRQLSAAHQGQPAEQRRRTEFSSYFDHTLWEPSLTPPTARFGQRMSAYFDFAKRLTPVLPGVKKGSPLGKDAETMAQVRSRWRFINEKTEFSLSRSRNNQPDQSELLRRFQGVQDSRVTTAENTTWGSAWSLEWRREKRRSMDFLRTESRFQRQEIENNVGRVARTYPQNEFSVEGGWRMSFTPVILQRPWIGMLISGIWNTQFENPRIESSYAFPKPAGADCPGGLKESPEGNCSAAFDARTGRTSRYLAKAGLRRETRDSWGEVGLFAGSVRRTVSYTFLNNAACKLRDSLLSTCLKGLKADQLQPATPRQVATMGQGLETGAFFNFNWRIPLRPDSAVQLVLENRGRLYFNSGRDFPLDTRLNNLFSVGLSVPLAGKLALKPTWSLFHFINKASVRDPLARPSWGLTSNAFEMKLEYRFDWLEGQSWQKVLRYGAGIK